MATKISTYIANLGKSVAYAAVDKMGKMAPTTSDLVQTNSELFKEVTHNIINYKTTYIVNRMNLDKAVSNFDKSLKGLSMIAKSNNISIVKFAENLENEIETKNPNLYCNLKITPYFYDDKINNNTILRVEKLKK